MLASRRGVVALLAGFAVTRAGSARDLGHHLDVHAAGAVGDGVSDDTAALKRAHATGQPLYYPKPARFYRTTAPLEVTNDVLGDGSEIRMVQNGTGDFRIFNIVTNARPLTITGMVLNGSYRDGAAGEQSHGIYLAGARNVRISGNVITNVYGDCVYVGSHAGRPASEDIVIAGNRLASPRRCNVAIVSGDRVSVVNNDLVRRSDYVAAIDLEPDENGSDFVRNVRIANNRFDVAGFFLSAGVSNAIAQSRIVVTGNNGRAATFFRAARSARWQTGLVSENTFHPASRDGGAMLDWTNVHGVRVLRNSDGSACSGGTYRSVRLIDCEVALSANSFCTAIERPWW